MRFCIDEPNCRDPKRKELLRRVHNLGDLQRVARVSREAGMRADGDSDWAEGGLLSVVQAPIAITRCWVHPHLKVLNSLRITPTKVLEILLRTKLNNEIRRVAGDLDARREVDFEDVVGDLASQDPVPDNDVLEGVGWVD